MGSHGKGSSNWSQASENVVAPLRMQCVSLDLENEGDKKQTETSAPENRDSSGALLEGKGCWILRIIDLFRRRTKKITRTAATTTMTPAKVPAITGREEDMCGTVGSESRVVVDAADVDCNTDGVDIGALFIGENNPGLAGMGNEAVVDAELQKKTDEISIR